MADRHSVGLWVLVIHGLKFDTLVTGFRVHVISLFYIEHIKQKDHCRSRRYFGA